MRRLFCSVLAVLGGWASVLRAQPADGPPPDRVALLARGVNLSHWIWHPQAHAPEARLAFITVEDIKQLAAAGFMHARLPFEPASVWDTMRHAPKPEGVAELRACIDTVLAGGLAVVVDAHPSQTDWVKADADGRFTEFERCWTALAAELAATDPSRVFLEVLNEPHDLPKSAAGVPIWPAALARLVDSVRAGAPRHTLIVTGEDWGGIDGLLKLAPLADPNVVYSFHFYDPMVFTHQGATWGWAPWKHMKNVPYPVSVDTVKGAVESIADKTAADAVRRYGEETWGRERVRARLDKAIAWSCEHHVAVYCGEFGVYRPFAPRTSRLAWLRDVRAVLDESHVGWAMWDYCGGFAAADGVPGMRALDDEVLDALGLLKPEPGALRPNR